MLKKVCFIFWLVIAKLLSALTWGTIKAEKWIFKRMVSLIDDEELKTTLEEESL